MILAWVVTVSDRCSRGEAEDLSGPTAARLLAEYGIAVEHIEVVPDDVAAIRCAVEEGVEAGARLVLTTGGTGLSPRDVTPEATEPLLDMRLDGLADAIRRRGATKVPTAVLSRGLAGVTSREGRQALVVNVPGSTGGVQDAVTVLGPLVHHVLDQLAGGDHPRVHGPARSQPGR